MVRFILSPLLFIPRGTRIWGSSRMSLCFSSSPHRKTQPAPLQSSHPYTGASFSPERRCNYFATRFTCPSSSSSSSSIPSPNQVVSLVEGFGSGPELSSASFSNASSGYTIASQSDAGIRWGRIGDSESHSWYTRACWLSTRQLEAQRSSKRHCKRFVSHSAVVVAAEHGCLHVLHVR